MRRCIAAGLAVVLLLSALCACTAPQKQEGLGNGWEPESTMALDYATEFSVDYYPGGYKLLTLGDASRFLVIPEGADRPEGIGEDIVCLYQPVENLYLAATAAMCLFDGLERLDAIRLSGARAQAWYIPNARQAMEEGRILFAGKYSEPDYEMILDNHCPLAVESLMIGHASEVKEKLEELGVAVLVDQSSNETHPLGRTEWIKLYGALLNEEERAAELFDRQKEYLPAGDAEGTGTTVAFFHISSSGRVVVRRSGDYVSRMIDMAGGDYVFHDLGDPDSGTSTVAIEMETFFATAKDADCIIYNSTIDGELESLADLLAKNELLAEFKAVQTGNVWCTGENMYQETTQLGQMIESFHRIFSGEGAGLDEVPFLRRLR